MYCTVDEVRGMIKADLLNALIGDTYIEDSEEREARITPIIEQTIVDACAEIDGYLAKRYPVPLTVPPPSIARSAKDIAVYGLVSRIGVGDADAREQNYRKRYEDVIRFLELIAKGTVDLGITPPQKQAATGFKLTGPERLFSRDQLKGM